MGKNKKSHKAERMGHLFEAAFAETKSRHRALKSELKLVHPTVRELWKREYPREVPTLVRGKDFKRFMVIALMEAENTVAARQATVEYLKTLAALMGRPDLRRVAVSTAQKYAVG